jgi:hypothetical protein
MKKKPLQSTQKKILPGQRTIYTPTICFLLSKWISAQWQNIRPQSLCTTPELIAVCCGPSTCITKKFEFPYKGKIFTHQTEFAQEVPRVGTTKPLTRLTPKNFGPACGVFVGERGNDKNVHEKWAPS